MAQERDSTYTSMVHPKIVIEIIIFYIARLGQHDHKCQKKSTKEKHKRKIHNDQTYTNIASQKELSQTNTA